MKDSLRIYLLISIFLILLCYSFLIKYINLEDRIVIYSCMEEYRTDSLIEKIAKEFPNKSFDVQFMSLGNLAAKLKVEKNNIDADIIIDFEKTYSEDLKDNFYTLDNVNTEKYIYGINPEHKKYLTWIKYSAGFIVNEEVLKEKNLEVPHSYDDLLKPEYEGLIAMPDPKNSGTGFMIMQNIINVYGEEKAFEYFDKFQNNVKEFTSSGMGPVNLLKQKEIAIGLGMVNQAVIELNNGAPLKAIIPETGAPYNTTTIEIIDGKEKKEGVLEVFEWLINDFGVYDKSYNMPEKVLKNQENKVPNFPLDIKYGDMTGIDDLDNKERLLEKWKY